MKKNYFGVYFTSVLAFPMTMMLLTGCGLARPTGVRWHEKSHDRGQKIGLQQAQQVKNNKECKGITVQAIKGGENDEENSMTCYRLQRGDSLWRIAQKHQTTVAILEAIIVIDDPHTLAIGKPIWIPNTALGSSEQIEQTEPAKKSLEKQKSVTTGTRTIVSHKVIPAEAPPVRVAVASVPVGPATLVKAKSSPSVSMKAVNKKTKTVKYTSKKSNRTLLWPVEAGKIISRYGKRSGKVHDGIDIGAPKGTPVLAALDGEVLFSATHGSYGNLVVLSHANGMVTVYAHHKVNLVRKGQRVKAGQLIARVGNSGRSKSPHLHFEVRKGTTPVNPLPLLKI